MFRDMSGGPPPLIAPAAEGALKMYYNKNEILQYFTEEEQERLQQEVIQSVNHELVHPEDLDTCVPKLHQSCETEAADLRRSINSIVSLQMVEAQRALELVRSSSERVNGLRLQLLKQAELISGVEEETLPLKHLRQLHILRQNVVSVIHWATALKEVRYENLFVLVEKRRFSELYEKVKALQGIRRTVINKAGSRYRIFESVFDPYFSKLDLISKAFVTELCSLLEEDGVNIAIQQALAENENEETPGFTHLKECCRVCIAELEDTTGSDTSSSSSSSPSSFPNLNAGEKSSAVLQVVVMNSETGEGRRVPGITSEKLEACVQKNIAQLWKNQVLPVEATQTALESPTEYFHRLKKVEPLMEAVQMILVPLSSPHFLYFDTVMRTLHDCVLEAMDIFVEKKDELDANVLVQASQYLQWYTTMLRSYPYASFLKKTEEIDHKSDLCMTAAVSGLSAHLTRLCQACALEVFKHMPTAPPPPSASSSTASRFLVTCGPVDLFSILQQTLSGLSTSMEVDVMKAVGHACADAICTYLITCKNGLDYDTWEEKYENEMKAEKLGGGSGGGTEGKSKNQPCDGQNNAEDKEWEQRRLLLLYAISNDVDTIKNNVDAIKMRFSMCWDFTNSVGSAGGVSAPWITPEDASPFPLVHEALSDLSVYCLEEIHSQVDRVMAAPWGQMFRSGPWYDTEKNPLHILLATQVEYIDEEYRLMMTEPKVRKLATRMLSSTAHHFISSLLEFLADTIRNSRKFPVDDWGVFVEHLVRDIELIGQVWQDRVPREVSRDIYETSMEAMHLMKELLCVKKPVDFEFLIRDSLIEKFGDSPSFVIQYTLDCRPGQIKAENKERMMAIWKEIIRPQQRDSTDILPPGAWDRPPSVFGHLNRDIAQYYKPGGFFSKSAKKKLLAERQQRLLQEKERRRRERSQQSKQE